MFRLAPSTDTTGITIMSEIEVAPALLVRRFGAPAAGDGYKVSGEYVFVDSAGEPFVVHDWKSTNLWEKELLSPEQFWASQEPAELCVSSRDQETGEFERWFLARLREE